MLQSRCFSLHKIAGLWYLKFLIILKNYVLVLLPERWLKLSGCIVF